MIYVIHGEEEYFIKEKLSQIINSDNEISEFAGSDKSFNIDIMIDACNSISLFSDKTTVVVNEPYFLIKKIDDKELDILDKYVKNPPYETDLILYTLSDNFNVRSKAYKLLSENAQIIKCNSLDHKNFPAYASQRLNEEKLVLNNDCIQLLISMCKDNATIFNQNIELLKLYPEQINTKVISRLCSSFSDQDSFEFINALTRKDISKSIALERRMLKDNDNIMGIISLLAGQLRYLYHVACLSSIGKRNYEIQELTGSKEYRVTMALKTLENLNMEQIIELLHKLSELDCLCKSDNSLSDISRFELFILNLLKRGSHAVN